MGDALSAIALESFSDELQKMAQGDFFRRVGQVILRRGVKPPLKAGLRLLGGIGQTTKDLLGGTGEIANRLSHPIEGMRTAWRESSPLPELTRRAKELGYDTPQAAAAALKTTDPAKYEKLMGKGWVMPGAGEHLLHVDPTAGKVRGLAERLSRSGWTGAGKATKYLPIGTKGLTVGFTAAGIPSVINAAPATPTGEGGKAEAGLAEAATGLGTLLATGGGIGIVPAMGLMMGGRAVGSRLGRVIDRVRAGASLPDAISAPSPTEAADQLAQIQKYYG